MTNQDPLQGVRAVRYASRAYRSRGRASRGILAAALLTTAALIGCAGSDSLTGPQSAPLAPPARPSGLITDPTPTRFPFEGTDENRCLPGEMVPVHGYMAYSMFVSDGDVTHEKVKWSLVVDGTGSLSGSTYHGAEEYLEEINVSFLPMEWTEVHNVRMVSQDKSVPDYTEKYLFHLTISGTGEATASVERGPTVDCNS
jgi:hypothetical protein